MTDLDAELRRVFGDPPVAPRAVMRVQVAAGQGLQAGRDEADRFVDAGADLVVLDSEGASAPALTAIAALLDLDPVAAVGTSTAPGWREQVVEVRDLLRTARRHVHDPAALAADPALGRQVGLLERLAARRTPVLLGAGTTTAAAALLARRLLPGADAWWLAGAAPAEAAGRLALTAAGLTPLLDLGVRAGSADLAVALVRTRLEQLGA